MTITEIEKEKKTLSDMLNDVEVVWRDEVRTHFPLWGEIEVVKEAKKIELGRDWSFYTDLKKIFALIFKDKELIKKFETSVSKYWGRSGEELARDTLHYLLFHELYHPLKAPFSKEDNKKIHQAIRKGILKAEPHLKPREQVMKVLGSQNGVKDFILDNEFYLDNKEFGWVADDIIPIWDFLELENSPEKTNFYTITRFLYASFYGPERIRNFFASKTKNKGIELAAESINALLNENKTITKSSLIDKVKKYFAGSKEKVFNNTSEVVNKVRNVFSSNDRYSGIERLMSVLGPYVEQKMPDGRNDVKGEGAGVDNGSILQDLLEDMTQEEQQEFLQELAGDTKSEGTESSERLDLIATHEFYKRNCPQVKIKSKGKIGEQVIVGKKEKFVLKSSKIISEAELSKLNLRRIAIFQRRTKQPVLIPVGKGVYRLNDYEIKSTELKDIVYKEIGLEIPDIVEFYLDSSGSMFHQIPVKGVVYKVNDNSSFDMLSQVLYGYLTALNQASKLLKKNCKVVFHNFADTQISTEEIDVNEFLEKPSAEFLKKIFEPNNGFNTEALNIKMRNDGRKRAYVVVTDGDITEELTKRESEKMIQLAKQKNNNVLLFEIGGTYSLGNAVKVRPEIHYSPVHDKNKMLKDGLEVLLTK